MSHSGFETVFHQVGTELPAHARLLNLLFCTRIPVALEPKALCN